MLSEVYLVVVQDLDTYHEVLEFQAGKNKGHSPRFTKGAP